MHAAIAFASEDRISRSHSGNGNRAGRSASVSSVCSSAYGASTTLSDERTGSEYCYAHKLKPAYHEVMLPDWAPGKLVKAEGSEKLSLLWNAVEAAERRKDAQVARHLVLALPDAEEVSLDDRIELARTFAARHFVSEGLGVQLDIHPPEIDEEGNESNWHAHLLITTRRFRRDRTQPDQYFEDRKARDLDPLVRSGRGYRYVAEGTLWGEEWRAHQDQFFRRRGYRTRVDLNGLVPQIHLGPKRSWVRRATSELSELQERIEANRLAAYDPKAVLEALTRYNGHFTEDDLARFLAKNLKGEEPAEIAAMHAAVMANPEVRALLDPETNAETGRFTTREVRRQERAAMTAAAILDSRQSRGIPPEQTRAAQLGRSLRDDQRKAFEHAIGPGDLKLIEGRAGTGKSYTLSAIRDAYERAGKQVVGLAPTNAVARDMASDGFKRAGTVHSALFKLNNGRERWDENTVVMVDETAMLGAVITGELLDRARRAGAKLILVGDDRQLASIERGGLFSAMLKQYGSAEVTGVVRQQVEWQRRAAQDLAQYRFVKALTAFDMAGAITWTGDQDEARAALVAAWARDGAIHPGDRQFVFAYTNRDADALNAELRRVRRARGELGGADVTFVTTRGSTEFGFEERPESFARGDRVQFTKTAKARHIYNGNVGTITDINPATGQITAQIDGKPGRQVMWNAHEFRGFQLGYAGTIYKGQGRTLDRTYLYHTDHWRADSSYVALTRQRKHAQVFVARETAANLDKLAWQMERSDIRCASLEWATRDDPALEMTRGAASPERTSSAAAERPDLLAGRAQFAERRARFEQGRLRFQESLAAHREDRQMAIARDWVRNWYRLVRDFYQALPGLGRDPAYGQARMQLLTHARGLEDERLRTMLRERDELTTVPSGEGELFGQTARQALRFAVSAAHPIQAVAGMVEQVENAERTESLERQRRAELEAKEGGLWRRNRIDSRG